MARIYRIIMPVFDLDRAAHFYRQLPSLAHESGQPLRFGIATGQALAELLTREKDRGILVMAPARAGADELEMRAYEAKIGRLNPLTHVDGFDDPAGAKPTPSSNDAIEKTQQDRIVH